MVNNNKRVLRECYGIQYEHKAIKEAIQKEEPVVVGCLFQRSDSPNSNGRIYPRAILEREVNKYNTLINSRSSFMELDHPEESVVVSLSKACAIVTECHWEGNELKGKIEVLTKTPCGAIVAGLMSHNTLLSVSSRGVGSTIQEGGSQTETVSNDYNLISWDLVSVPSVENANLFNESLLRDGRYLTEGFSLDKLTAYAIRNKYKSIDEILGDILQTEGV